MRRSRLALLPSLSCAGASLKFPSELYPVSPEVSGGRHGSRVSAEGAPAEPYVMPATSHAMLLSQEECRPRLQPIIKPGRMR